MKRVLVIEDNEDIAEILLKRLKVSGYEAERIKDGIAAISRMMSKGDAPDAIILDMMLPGRMGMDLLNSIKCTWDKTKIFVFSAHREYENKIPKECIHGFFCKTDGVDLLLAEMKKAVEK